MTHRLGLLLLVTLAVTACAQLTSTAPPSTVAVVAPDDAMAGTVERVVDGDTVIVEVAGERERVRLLRIDTPEAARDGGPAECLADAATAALAELLPAGAPVELATDVEVRDRYGRLLAHLWANGTWVNGAMLEAGYADVITFPPNVAHDDEVRAAVQRARDAEAGLWDPGAC